jgi:transient receptor potential cation channel subfamily C
MILLFSGTHQTLKRLEVAIEANQKSFVAHPSVQQLLSGIYYDGLPGFRRLHVFRQLLVVLKHACMFPIFSMAYMVAPNCKMGQLCKKPFLKFIFESASYMFFLFLLALASQKIEHVVFDVISKYIKSDSKRKAQPNELAILRPFLAMFLATTLIFFIKLRF